jgi:hypothetical protein
MTILSTLDFIQLSPNQETATYVLSEDFSVFSLVNVPMKMTSQQLIEQIGVNPNEICRIYKKSLFWILVMNRGSAAVNEKLKNLKLDDSEVKYEYLNRNQLIKNINKLIQTSNYQKEAHELKAEKEKMVQSSNNNKDRTNSEALSWRKKSNDQSNAASPKISIE